LMWAAELGDLALEMFERHRVEAGGKDLRK
jgi:hypothetical protein